MKRIKILSILSIAALSVFTFSCKKTPADRSILAADPGAPVLTVTPSAPITMFYANADSTVVNASWTKASYGFDANVQYILQIAKSEGNLGETMDSSKGITYPASIEMSRSYMESEINAAALKFGIAPTTTGKIYFRVVSVLANNPKYAPLKSNVAMVTVTSYEVLKPRMYVPGDYQGWSPNTSDYLESNFDNIFVGTIEKTKTDGTLSSGDFKFTSAPDWGHTNYGMGASAGTLSTDGSAGNVSLVDGTYKFSVDATGLTYTAELVNWGLIGSATAGGWGSDQNFRYNAMSKKYEITTDLIDGEVKFRLNDDWGTNLGDDGNNLSAEPNGANIPVTAGNYTIKLDVEAKTYTITKN
jgi:starch-binding outer membrane protein SusE/F